MRPLLLLVICLLPAFVQAQTPRYYIVVRDVEGPPGAALEDGAARLARTVLLEELGRRPEVLVDGLPAGEEALRQELSRRRLRGYQLTLRLLSVTRALNPPPPGKQYRVLERGVRLTVIGTTLPGDQLAVGGDGESTVQADVGAQVGPHKEQELLLEALRDAIGQAVRQVIRKLDKGGMVPPQEKPKPRRK